MSTNLDRAIEVRARALFEADWHRGQGKLKPPWEDITEDARQSYREEAKTPPQPIHDPDCATWDSQQPYGTPACTCERADDELADEDGVKHPSKETGQFDYHPPIGEAADDVGAEQENNILHDRLRKAEKEVQDAEQECREDEGVIRVWRRRTTEAETRVEELRQELKAIHDCPILKEGCPPCIDRLEKALIVLPDE